MVARKADQTFVGAKRRFTYIISQFAPFHNSQDYQVKDYLQIGTLLLKLTSAGSARLPQFRLQFLREHIARLPTMVFDRETTNITNNNYYDSFACSYPPDQHEDQCPSKNSFSVIVMDNGKQIKVQVTSHDPIYHQDQSPCHFDGSGREFAC